MSILTVRAKGQRVIASGNDAVARGALEAGIGHFSTYPGAPIAEIADSIEEIAGELPGLHFEYSINECVALEGAIGASFASVRAMVTMKHVGLNVAADALHGLGYQSYLIDGGLVIVNGADPGGLSSSNEQDNHWYALHTHIPFLEPSNLQEAKDFTVRAFEGSERFRLPFILNIPIQLCHAAGDLVLGELPEVFPERGEFKFRRFAPPAGLGRVEGRHFQLLDKERQVREFAANCEFNRLLPGDADWGVVTYGTCYGYTLEALDLLGLYDVPILKLGLIHPVSPELLGRFLQPLRKVIVVEELEGFLENEVKRLAYDLPVRPVVLGKEIFSPIGELSGYQVAIALGKHLGIELPSDVQDAVGRQSWLLESVPPRNPTFCPGCPHRGSVYALKKATEGKAVYAPDIGCYAMAAGPPYSLFNWTNICMGAGIGITQGMSHKTAGQLVTAMMGDSTFFHSGLQSVLNAVYNGSNVLLLLLDNSWIGMTGHQPTPSTELTVAGEPIPSSLSIEDVLRALGVKYIRMVDPYDPRSLMAAICEAIEQPGVKVILCKRECALQSERRKRFHPTGEETFLEIQPERCPKCDECFAELACPAIVTQTTDGSTTYQIDEGRCTRCGMCKVICPNGAITMAVVNPHLVGSPA